MSERWMPEIEDVYWTVDFGYTKEVRSVRWVNDKIDNMTYKSGNCFRTEDEAATAAEKVKELLLSLHDITQDKPLPKLTAEVFDRPDCPEWAKYVAVDSDGDARYHERYPRLSKYWWVSDGDIKGVNYGKFDATDWQNSLIERPTKDAFDKLLKNYAEQQANKIWQKARERRLSEQYHNGPAETKLLPDWCKPGEWVYLSNGEYDKIESIDGFGINLASRAIINKKYIHEEAVSARLHPYNAEEMRGLVGKVLMHPRGNYLVTFFSNTLTHVKVAESLCAPDELLAHWTQLDGSPCGVLEHLENGEWVE